MDGSKHLANSRLFGGLSDAGLSELLQIAQMEMFDSDHRIFSEGDSGQEFYVVMEGEIRISLSVAGGEEALGIRGAGESFGEMSLMGTDTPRSATAIAHTDCTVLTFSKVELLELLDSDHDIAYVVFQNLLSEMTAHLRAANERLMFLTATGRF